MSRGSAEFTTMKGYMDGFVIKQDGHESDTMPPEASGDVTEQAEVEVAKKPEEGKQGENIKSSDNKTGDAATTMSEDVAEVADAAETPIDDGYVQDAQGDKVSTGGDVEKGWDAYNQLCNEGVVVKDFGMTRDNVGGVLDAIYNDVHRGDDLVTKCNSKSRMVRKAEGEDMEDSEEKPKEDKKDESFSEEGAEEEKSFFLEGSVTKGRAALAKKLGLGLAGGAGLAAYGAGTGALTGGTMGAAAAGKGKRGEGFKRGASRGAKHGAYSLGAVSPYVGAAEGGKVAAGKKKKKKM